jgi:hypothetical protein
VRKGGGKSLFGERACTYNINLSVPKGGWSHCIIFEFFLRFFVRLTLKTYMYVDEISGSRGGEYEDDCLLGCCAV